MGAAEIDWRGPRPLQQTDELIGRTRELHELCDRCESYDIIQITAPSGVGKTSFVTAGGVAALQDEGYVVPPVRPWSELFSHPLLRERTATDEYAQILYRLVIGAPDHELEPDGRGPGAVVQALAGDGRMAVVIDQAEELLRYQRDVGNALLEIAGEAAHRSMVPHIVIARTEYRERLRPMERRGAKVWNLFLDEITSERALAEIITAPVERADASIDPEAVAQLIAWWSSAKYSNIRSQEASSELFGGVGLLHLQSLLWSFGEWAKKAGIGDRIRLADLTAFASARGTASGFALDAPELLGGWLIEDAIVSYVHDQVEQATAAPTFVRDGERHALRWANGPRLLLARVAPALSSGGYKVPQAKSSLIPLALGEELTSRGARTLASKIRRGEDYGDWADKTTNLEGAGLAAGWPRSEIVSEMVGALESILQALSAEEANILRGFNVSEEAVFELVHDGVGPALTKWSQAFLELPVSAVGVISAQVGGAFGHDLTPDVFLDDAGAVAPHWGAVTVTRDADAAPRAVVENLRWASNYVGPFEHRSALVFRDVTLRDCDFTGAAFVRCELRDVTFERCTFKGAVMIACVMDGVRFAPDPAGGAELNLLTVKESVARRPVVFAGLKGTTGIFLESLQGGEWEFRDCDGLEHLVISAEEGSDTTIRLLNTTAAHVTVRGGARTELDGSALLYEELGS